MATIGKLAVQITADTAGLASGLATAGRQTDDFQNRLGGLTSKLKILGPAAIAAGGAFAVGMVKSVANTADELAKLSARTGIAVEDLSRLQYAAGLSGVSNETLTASLDKLSRGMAEAATGSGAAGEAFKAMGLNVKNQDGTLKSQSEMMSELADRFANYADGAEKTALAQQIFGRSGAQLIPLLNSGAQGLRDMAEESDRLGNTISTRTAKSAEEFNDNISRLTTAMGGLARTIAGPVIESMAKFTTSMFDAWKQGDTLFGMLEAGFKRLGQANTIDAARAKVNELEEAMHRMRAAPGFDESAMGAMMLAKNLDEARARLAELLAEQQKAAAGPAGGGALSAPVVSTGGEKTTPSQLIEQLDALDQMILDKMSERNTVYVEQLQTRLDALRESFATESEITQEKHLADMELLRLGLEEKLLTEQEFNELRAQAEQELQDKLAAIREKAMLDDMARIQKQSRFEIDARTAVANAAIGLLSQLGAKSKVAAVAAIALGKALSIAQIIQNTAVAQMRALAELGPIAGPPAAAKIGALGKVQAGIVAATGLVQAAGVLSSGGGSVATGGAIEAAATGSSGLAGGAGGAVGGGARQTVTIQLQGETFGREAVRNLISEINEAISDGAVLRLA